jgi:hypothetical protein
MARKARSAKMPREEEEIPSGIEKRGRWRVHWNETFTIIFLFLPGGMDLPSLLELPLVAHELASLARRNTHAVVWLGQSPACVADLIKKDCKPST